MDISHVLGFRGSSNSKCFLRNLSLFFLSVNAGITLKADVVSVYDIDCTQRLICLPLSDTNDLCVTKYLP